MRFFSEKQDAILLFMRLVQPLKWHGGKYYQAMLINGLIPPHKHYVEPYFGGGAVWLVKEHEGISEVVNDINWKLTNFWRVLQDPTMFRKLYRRVQLTPFSQIEWKDSFDIMTDLPDTLPTLTEDEMIDYACRFFIWVRQSRQGLCKDFATLSSNRVRRGMNEQASAWLGTIDGLEAVHDRLKGVVITEEDAPKLIKQEDGINTFYYLDPTYLPETRTSNDNYEFEMTPTQHEELLVTLGGIKGLFILSGYGSDMYFDAQKKYGWNCEKVHIDNKASSKKKKEVKIEHLWMNYDIKDYDAVIA